LNSLFSEGVIGDSKFGKSSEKTAYEKQADNIAYAAMNAATSLEELNKAKQEGLDHGAIIYQEEYNENLERLAENAFGSAKSLSELIDVKSDYIAAGLDAKKVTELYDNAILNLANSYANASEEVKRYEEAMKNGSSVSKAVAEAQLKNAITLGEKAEELGIDAVELEKLTSEIVDKSGETFTEALKFAAGYLTLAQKLNISVEDLQTHLADLVEAFSLLTIQ
jgi:hypothetical protein